jgi:OFA family oxalate/formate antiporter-like MFS transporter
MILVSTPLCYFFKKAAIQPVVTERNVAAVDSGVCMPTKTARSYVLIACACAIFWPGAFIFGFPGILRQHWQQAFEADGGAVGGTVFFILAGATCFMYLCGRWQEKFGPARLAAFGAVMCGCSAIWLSHAANMTEVYIWAFSTGAASAFVYLPGLTVVQRWYPEKRGLVAGFFNMSFGLSAAVISPVFTLLLLKWGYEALTLAAGCAALTIGLIASALIRFPEADRLAPASTASTAPISRSVKEALKSREFWCLWFTWVFAGAAGASMLVLASGFGLARGLSLANAVVLLTAFNLTNGCGRLISGYFSDRIGRSRTMAISFSGAGVAYLIMPHLSGLWWWAAWLQSSVLPSAPCLPSPVRWPAIVSAWALRRHLRAGVYRLRFVAGPLGPWLSGHILDVTRGNYTLVFSLLGLMYFLAAGLILVVQPWRECRFVTLRFVARQALNAMKPERIPPAAIFGSLWPVVCCVLEPERTA